MNREETLKILASIKAAYPSFASVDFKATTNLWENIFEEIPYQIVNAAVIAFISSETKGFPPSAGQINSMCRKITHEEMNEHEAVTRIIDATKNGIYGYMDEFEKLPDICKKIVVHPERLRDWALLPKDEVQTVIASNLRHAFNSEKNRSDENMLIPKKIKDKLNDWKVKQIE